MPSRMFVDLLQHQQQKQHKYKQQPKKQQSTNFKCYSNFVDNNWSTFINVFLLKFSGVNQNIIANETRQKNNCNYKITEQSTKFKRRPIED
jgi:hypothetical protein